MSVQRTDGSGGARTDQLRETQQQQNTERAAGRTREPNRRGDRLEISPQAREAERLRQLADDVSDIREERVDKARVARGRVAAERLARLLLDANEV